MLPDSKETECGSTKQETSPAAVKNWDSFSTVLRMEVFFLIGIHSMHGSTATTRHGVARKRSTKRLKHTRNLFRKNLQLKDVC